MNRFCLNNSFRNLCLFSCLLLQMCILTSCAGPLRIQHDFVPVGSLRLAQVMALGTRNVVTNDKDLYQGILESGVSDSEIVDGSIAMARVHCCGGFTKSFSAERENAIMVYIPKGLKVDIGDIVEVRVGRSPKSGEAGLLHTVTRVVQKYKEKGEMCWWDPRDDRLWLRVLYCDWMQKEGWIKQGGTKPAWFKPPSSASSGS